MALRDRRLAALAVAAVLLAACGSSPAPSATPSAALATPTGTPPGPTATPAPTLSNDQIVAGIEASVQQIRELKQKSPVGQDVLTPAQLSAKIQASFDQTNPPALVAANERVAKALGLFPQNASLKDLYVQLLSSQVAGLYDPDTKTMDVVSKTGQLGPIEQISYAHEFDHALQDQNFGLNKLDLNDTSNSDRALARLSLPEGDATLLMSLWAQQNLTPGQLLEMVAEASDPSQTAILNAMPDDLKETLLFPYEQGLTWVGNMQALGGWAAVDAAYAKPPDSTEQILHLDKWASHEEPIAVTIPASLPAKLGSGWTMPLTDTFGELQFRIWLEQTGKVDSTKAVAAAAGWGGDRMALVEKGNTYGIVMISKWDTPADATEFAAAAGPTLKLLPSSTAMIDPGSTNQVVLFIASDQATITALAAALGLAG
ncbi:MAG TPA: hypothetical protein VKR24_00225 [Candidatus Limnocylindrales bacterium]|nr:hypothetical protein [Candidatus Limnocylindrales bacterium]